jgi:hypothetical protein
MKRNTSAGLNIDYVTSEWRRTGYPQTVRETYRCLKQSRVQLLNFIFAEKVSLNPALAIWSARMATGTGYLSMMKH